MTNPYCFLGDGESRTASAGLRPAILLQPSPFADAAVRGGFSPLGARSLRGVRRFKRIIHQINFKQLFSFNNT